MGQQLRAYQGRILFRIVPRFFPALPVLSLGFLCWEGQRLLQSRCRGVCLVLSPPSVRPALQGGAGGDSTTPLTPEREGPSFPPPLQDVKRPLWVCRAYRVERKRTKSPVSQGPVRAPPCSLTKNPRAHGPPEFCLVPAWVSTLSFAAVTHM